MCIVNRSPNEAVRTKAMAISTLILRAALAVFDSKINMPHPIPIALTPLLTGATPYKRLFGYCYRPLLPGPLNLPPLLS